MTSYASLLLLLVSTVTAALVLVRPTCQRVARLSRVLTFLVAVGTAALAVAALVG